METPMIIFIVAFAVLSLWTVFLIGIRLKTISELENKISLFEHANEREGGRKIRSELGKYVDKKSEMEALLDAEEQRAFDIGYHNYMKSFLKK